MNYITQLKKQKEIVNRFFDKKEIYTGKYRDGGWTGKEVLIHLKDAETIAYDRIRRTISEENPVLWFFEQDLWQQHLNYMEQDIQLAKNVFTVTRDSIIEAVAMHLKKYGSKTGVHSRRGIMSLNELVEFLIWHTDHHLKQIKKIRHSD
jgi:hypothetical protein